MNSTTHFRLIWGSTIGAALLMGFTEPPLQYIGGALLLLSFVYPVIVDKLAGKSKDLLSQKSAQTMADLKQENAPTGETYIASDELGTNAQSGVSTTSRSEEQDTISGYVRKAEEITSSKTSPFDVSLSQDILLNILANLGTNLASEETQKLVSSVLALSDRAMLQSAILQSLSKQDIHRPLSSFLVGQSTTDIRFQKYMVSRRSTTRPLLVTLLESNSSIFDFSIYDVTSSRLKQQSNLAVTILGDKIPNLTEPGRERQQTGA